MSDAPKLKPCPLCGGPAEIWRARPENPKRRAWIACMGRCAVLTKEFASDAEAVTAWNRRTPSPAAIRAEALEEAAKEADRAELEFWEDWKERADPNDQGRSDGAAEVASRIRALIEQPAEGGEDG